MQSSGAFFEGGPWTEEESNAKRTEVTVSAVRIVVNAFAPTLSADMLIGKELAG